MARSKFDGTENEISELINFESGDGRKFELLKITVAIETDKQKTFYVPLTVHYTNLDNIDGANMFKRDVPSDWREAPHAEHDLERSVLFCCLRKDH